MLQVASIIPWHRPGGPSHNQIVTLGLIRS